MVVDEPPAKPLLSAGLSNGCLGACLRSGFRLVPQSASFALQRQQVDIGGCYQGNSNNPQHSGNNCCIFSQDIAIKHEDSSYQCQNNPCYPLREECLLLFSAYSLWLLLF